MPLSRSRVQLFANSIALLLTELGHQGSFRRILAKVSIAVFIIASLKRVVRVGEERFSQKKVAEEYAIAGLDML